MHAAEGEMICKSTNEKVPYFNAAIYLQNKTAIGKVDEIFGPTNILMFTIKVAPGVVATSFKEKDKVYINPEKLLPMARFTQPQCVPRERCRRRTQNKWAPGLAGAQDAVS